jgi:hypothetical protein
LDVIPHTLELTDKAGFGSGKIQDGKIGPGESIPVREKHLFESLERTLEYDKIFVTHGLCR